MRRLDDRNERKPENHPNKHDKRLGLGIVFIFIGIVFILSNTGLIPGALSSYVFSWQMILIVIGLFSIAGNKNKTAGLIMLSIGVFFIMPGILGFARFTLIKLWPVALIAVGAFILFRQKNGFTTDENTNMEIKYDGIDTIDDLNIFSGTVRNITSQKFQGRRVTCVFGGADYNFSKTGLANNQAVLDVLTIFGGTKIVVPSDWAVNIDVVSIFGGFADKRHSTHHLNISPENRLIIKGFTIFGGGEVKNY